MSKHSAVSDIARLATATALVSPPVLPVWLAAVAAGRALNRLSRGSIANAEAELKVHDDLDARLLSLSGSRSVPLREAR